MGCPDSYLQRPTSLECPSVVQQYRMPSSSWSLGRPKLEILEVQNKLALLSKVGCVFPLYKHTTNMHVVSHYNDVIPFSDHRTVIKDLVCDGESMRKKPNHLSNLKNQP